MSVYTVILEPYEEGYTASVPDVPGCVTGGKTLEEAVRMTRDALGGCLCVYEDEGVPLPPPRLPGEIPLPDGAFSALVDLDLSEYRRQTDTRAVRKSVSLPAWMARQADMRGLNCSQLLQDAIRRALS